MYNPNWRDILACDKKLELKVQMSTYPTPAPNFFLYIVLFKYR